MLSFETAQEMYTAMAKGIELGDELMASAGIMMFRAAARYAKIRAEWFTYPLQERAVMDDERTSAHDHFISSLNTIANMQGETGRQWRERLGNDRKEVGDFACYITLFRGLEAR